MKTAHAALKLSLLLCLAMAQFAAAQQAQTIRTNAYSIDLVLDPAHHSMTAQTAVTFIALKDLETVSFQLNPALRIGGVTDAAGQPLRAGRDSAGDDSIRVMPSTPLKQGESITWTFTYSGVFDRSSKENNDAKAAPAVQLASIGDPVSYLLYAARWFPMVGYMTDPFTATMHVHVPAGERVFGSGATFGSDMADALHTDKNGLTVFDFAWPRPGLPGEGLHGEGFPGTIIAGRYREVPSPGRDNVRVYLIDEKSGTTDADSQRYAAAADRIYKYFVSQYGPLNLSQPGQTQNRRDTGRTAGPSTSPSTSSGSGRDDNFFLTDRNVAPALSVVELPDGTVPAYSAPEIAAIAGRQMQGDNSSRLLANTIAHQWWGNDVSPATWNDAWITNGMCRYAELAYLEHTSKPPVFADAIFNVSASALAYDTVPLSNTARYEPFSTEFQAMTYDKGAMIFRMLQWQIGDAAFQQTLHGMLSHHDASISSADVERIAENASHQNLRPFFMQGLDSTGAPTLKDNWTLYRLGNNKGFRTIGEITEDLDLFQMPVEVRMETEGKTMTQRVDVSGPQTQFAIDTLWTPRNISLDPDRQLLRNDDDMQVRVHILRGQNMATANDSAGAIREYRLALGIDSISSLASYRLGEIYFEKRNYQAAADAFRDALHGDDAPKWIEVWSDLKLGEIFDASGQRDRAVNQYREALQTQDDTGGALDVARDYLQHAYQPPTP